MTQGYSVIGWEYKEWEGGNTEGYNGEEEETRKQLEVLKDSW